MAELSAKWWKKNKAKTLSEEPLLSALERLDEADKQLRAACRADVVEEYLDGLEAVEKAIAATKKKSSSVLHKETLKNLDDMGKLVDGAKKQIDHYLKSCRVFLKNVEAVIAGIDKAVTQFKSKPNSTTLATMKALMRKAVELLEVQDKPYPMIGDFFGTTGSAQLIGAFVSLTGKKGEIEQMDTILEKIANATTPEEKGENARQLKLRLDHLVNSVVSWNKTVAKMKALLK